jgi:hypothetical protein
MSSVARLVYRRMLDHPEGESRTGRQKKDGERRTSAVSAVSVVCEDPNALSALSRHHERVRRFYYPFSPTADPSPGVAPPGRKAPDCNCDCGTIAGRLFTPKGGPAQV